MAGRNILADNFKPTPPPGRNILADDFQSDSTNGNFLEDFLKRMVRESGKQTLGQVLGQTFGGISKPLEHVGERVGYGALPAVENLPGGIKEGLQSAYAGLTGGEFHPSEVSDEYGAGFGQKAGHMIGQGLIAAPIAALTSTVAGAVGVPALLSALGGTAIGFGATTPGNALDRSISGGEAAALHGAGKLIKNLLGGKIPVKDIINRGKNIFEVPKLREQAKGAKVELETAETDEIEQNKAIKAQRDEMEQNEKIGSSSENTIQRKANTQKAEKKTLESQLAETPEMNDSQMPPKPLINPEISDESIKESESLLKTKEQKAAEAEAAIEALLEAHENKSQEISTKLGLGNAHRKRVATKLNPILEKRQAEIGSGYDKYQEGLKAKEVTLSNPRDAKAITADIQKHLQQGDTSSKEMTALRDELANIGKGETIPADKFVSAYRSLRGMEQKTRSSAYGKSPQEFDRLIETADSMKKDLKMMKGIIDKGLGEDNLKELNKLDTRYATEVAPLFKNKFYQELQAKSKAPRNMLEALTDEPYIKEKNPNKVTGSKILNDIIIGDSELLHNVIGENFAKNPEALLEPNELLTQYTKHSPELQQMTNELAQTRNALESAKKVAKEAKDEHKSQKAIHEANAEVYKQQMTEAKEQRKLNKAEQERRDNVVQIFEKVESLNHSVSELEAASKEAQRLSNQENLSLKEKMRLKKEADKANAAYEKARSDRYKALIGLGILGSGGELIHLSKKAGIL